MQFWKISLTLTETCWLRDGVAHSSGYEQRGVAALHKHARGFHATVKYCSTRQLWLSSDRLVTAKWFMNLPVILTEAGKSLLIDSAAIWCLPERLGPSLLVTASRRVRSGSPITGGRSVKQSLDKSEILFGQLRCRCSGLSFYVGHLLISNAAHVCSPQASASDPCSWTVKNQMKNQICVNWRRGIALSWE